jgi:glucosamine--fructose-6-phosphate aminotransferase (isomerizing)
MLAKTHLFREIHEQPAVIRNLLRQEVDKAALLVEDIRERGIHQVLIAARGSSDNAGRYANYLFGAVNRLLVALATPSLFSLYRRPPRLENSLVLGISQSGKSPDIQAVLAEARRQGALTAALTNNPTSELGQLVEHNLYLHAGKERSLAATKTYTAELALIALLSALLATDEQMLTVLNRAPDYMAETLVQQTKIAEAAVRYRYMQHCVVIGRGFNYATAFELALKLKELTYSIVEAYSSADFLHGPLAVIDEGFPTIVIAPSGVTLPEIQDTMFKLKERGAEIIVVSDDRATLEKGTTPLSLPEGIPEWLSPLMAILPGQLFAMHLAFTRGYDIDHPRGLRKIIETY